MFDIVSTYPMYFFPGENAIEFLIWQKVYPSGKCLRPWKGWIWGIEMDSEILDVFWPPPHLCLEAMGIELWLANLKTKALECLWTSLRQYVCNHDVWSLHTIGRDNCITWLGRGSLMNSAPAKACKRALVRVYIRSPNHSTEPTHELLPFLISTQHFIWKSSITLRKWEWLDTLGKVSYS